MTIKIVPLPPQWHPIWRMGFKHVMVAHAIASAVFALGGGLSHGTDF